MGMNTMADTNCGPEQNPCSSNPTSTITWTCPDGYSCGSGVCVHICSSAQATYCQAGNYMSMDVTFPMGTCTQNG